MVNQLEAMVYRSPSVAMPSPTVYASCACTGGARLPKPSVQPMAIDFRRPGLRLLGSLLDAMHAAGAHRTTQQADTCVGGPRRRHVAMPASGSQRHWFFAAVHPSWVILVAVPCTAVGHKRCRCAALQRGQGNMPVMGLYHGDSLALLQV